MVYPGTLFHRRHSATPMHSYENRSELRGSQKQSTPSSPDSSVPCGTQRKAKVSTWVVESDQCQNRSTVTRGCHAPRHTCLRSKAWRFGRFGPTSYYYSCTYIYFAVLHVVLVVLQAGCMLLEGTSVVTSDRERARGEVHL